MKELEIGTNEAGQRLDKYLKKLLPRADSGFLYKMLRKKNIVLNGKKAEGSAQLSEGDHVTLYLSDETYEKFSPDKTINIISEQNRDHIPDIQILFENTDILILNKPAGLLSQKAVSSDFSANEWVIQYLLDSGAVTQQTLKTFRPSVCNRLDRNTSGILLAGKTLHGLQVMSRQLKERSVKKYYRCVVAGTLAKGQHLKAFLSKNNDKNKVEIYHPGSTGRGNGQYIETEYEPLGHCEGCTVLEVHLITGRSHQIRAHLSSIGHPIIGDPKYGDPQLNRKYRKKIGITHQLLHAYRIVLADGQEVTASLPEYFAHFMKVTI